MLREAAAARASVSLHLSRRRPRVLFPYALLLREGFWYVIGHDDRHDAVRTFRVDRIEGDVVGRRRRSRSIRPAGFDPLGVPDRPQAARRRGARPEPTVLVDAARARFVVDELGADAVVERRRTGRSCSTSPARTSTRSGRGCSGLGTHAEVLGPPRCAAPSSDGCAAMSRAGAVRNEPAQRAPAGRRSAAAVAGDAAVADGARARRRSPRWCARFELSERELVRDLEMAAMCGLPPFVDEMIDVYIDEGIVYAGVPRLFTKPLRLTAPEGFALLIAGRAAMQLPGADPQGRWRGRLASSPRCSATTAWSSTPRSRPRRRR